MPWFSSHSKFDPMYFIYYSENLWSCLDRLHSAYSIMILVTCYMKPPIFWDRGPFIFSSRFMAHIYHHPWKCQGPYTAVQGPWTLVYRDIDLLIIGWQPECCPHSKNISRSSQATGFWGSVSLPTDSPNNALYIWGIGAGGFHPPTPQTNRMPTPLHKRSSWTALSRLRIKQFCL